MKDESDQTKEREREGEGEINRQTKRSKGRERWSMWEGERDRNR